MSDNKKQAAWNCSINPNFKQGHDKEYVRCMTSKFGSHMEKWNVSDSNDDEETEWGSVETTPQDKH